MCGFFITEIFPRMGRLLLKDTFGEIFLEQRFYFATVCRDFKLLFESKNTDGICSWNCLVSNVLINLL